MAKPPSSSKPSNQSSKPSPALKPGVNPNKLGNVTISDPKTGQYGTYKDGQRTGGGQSDSFIRQETTSKSPEETPKAVTPSQKPQAFIPAGTKAMQATQQAASKGFTPAPLATIDLQNPNATVVPEYVARQKEYRSTDPMITELKRTKTQKALDTLRETQEGESKSFLDTAKKSGAFVAVAGATGVIAMVGSAKEAITNPFGTAKGVGSILVSDKARGELSYAFQSMTPAEQVGNVLGFVAAPEAFAKGSTLVKAAQGKVKYTIQFGEGAKQRMVETSGFVTDGKYRNIGESEMVARSYPAVVVENGKATIGKPVTVISKYEPYTVKSYTNTAYTLRGDRVLLGTDSTPSKFAPKVSQLGEPIVEKAPQRTLQGYPITEQQMREFKAKQNKDVLVSTPDGNIEFNPLKPEKAIVKNPSPKYRFYGEQRAQDIGTGADFPLKPGNYREFLTDTSSAGYRLYYEQKTPQLNYVQIGEGKQVDLKKFGLSEPIRREVAEKVVKQTSTVQDAQGNILKTKTSFIEEPSSSSKTILVSETESVPLIQKEARRATFINKADVVETVTKTKPKTKPTIPIVRFKPDSVTRVQSKMIDKAERVTVFEKITQPDGKIIETQDTRRAQFFKRTTKAAVVQKQQEDTEPLIDVDSRSGNLRVTEPIQDSVSETARDAPSVFKPARAFRPGDLNEPIIEEPPKTPFSKKSTKKKKGLLFDVLVRRAGKFQKVNKFALSEEGAFSLGQSRVKETAAASFKVVESGSRRGILGRLGSMFRPSKTERGVIVQKNQFRISSSGEKREIPFEGLRQQRAKRRRSIWA